MWIPRPSARSSCWVGMSGTAAAQSSLMGSVGSVKKVVILDYGSGNLRSAERALARVGADVTVTADAPAALEADGLVVPGVGAFAACMAGLRAVDGPKIIGRRLAGGRPVLGICVGMQILFERGVEHGHDAEGCGEWPGVVEPLKAPVLPHMGWNTVDAPADTVLFDGLADERFYFVHSYGVRDFPLAADGPPSPLAKPKVTWAEHGDRFVAGVENGPLSATQFHPEKSGDAGAQLLTNWLNTLH
jgi:glutamine amidotransferase